MTTPPQQDDIGVEVDNTRKSKKKNLVLVGVACLVVVGVISLSGVIPQAVQVISKQGLETNHILDESNNYYYDDGREPAVSLNNLNTVVECHKSNTKDALWYRTGTINEGTLKIDWRSSTHKFADDAGHPSVDINDHEIVVVAFEKEGQTTVQLGQHVKANDEIVFTEQSYTFEGRKPSVGINNDGVIILLVESEGIKWRGGRVSPSNDAIQWRHEDGTHLTDGGVPRVAISHNDVLEVHEASGLSSGLWASLGSVVGDDIIWTSSERYDYGLNPSVAISGSFIMEGHQTQGFGNGLFYKKVSSDPRTWNSEHSHEFGIGTGVDMAVNDRFALAVHKSQGYKADLYYTIGTRP